MFSQGKELESCFMPLLRKEFLKLAYDLAEGMHVRRRLNHEKQSAVKHGAIS